MKTPAIVLHEELSPPHTPHLSLFALEFNTWSQPACFKITMMIISIIKVTNYKYDALTNFSQIFFRLMGALVQQDFSEYLLILLYMNIFTHLRITRLKKVFCEGLSTYPPVSKPHGMAFKKADSQIFWIKNPWRKN